MNPNALALWSLAPLLAGALLGVTLDAFVSRRAALYSVLIGFGVAAGASINAAIRQPVVTSAWGTLHVGGVFATIAAVAAVLGGLAVAGGWTELSKRDSGGSLAGLMAFAATASIVVASSRDITLLLIALETAAVCAYALVAAGRGARAREAAMKYFLQGAIATGFFVFGMAVLVTVFIPTGDLDGLSTSLASSSLPASIAAAGIVLLYAALAFKAGVAPFHAWAPDAYESAAPESAAFLAAGPKLGAISALAILVAFTASGTAGQLQVPLSAVLAALAVLSLLIGSVGALRQRSYTRMLGYAGVAQVGYALIGIATTHTPSVPIFFMACYGLAATGTFLSAAAFRHIDPEWDGTVEGLAGMSRKAPWASAATAVLLISLAGIPPLLGFWAKFVVFLTAIGAAGSAFAGLGPTQLGWIYVVAVAVGILASVISLGYYGRALAALYQPSQADDAHDDSASDSAAETPSESGGSAASVVVLIAVLTVALGLLPLVTGIPTIWRLFG
jgi:NADH-quinone oxidoreductase subunit N